ncbi:UNVERIFIED_CONTAM: hypothetical protein OHV15_14935 [Microbacterium sp. SLM126]
MNPELREFRVEVLLSMMRALWEKVTPGLRGVTVHVGDARFGSRFLYEHQPDEIELEDVAVAETEVYADMLPDVDVSFIAVCLPSNEALDLLPGEEWVYVRKEPMLEEVRGD